MTSTKKEWREEFRSELIKSILRWDLSYDENTDLPQNPDDVNGAVEDLSVFIQQTIDHSVTIAIEELAKNFYDGGWDKLEASYYNDTKEIFIQNLIKLSHLTPIKSLKGKI